MKEGANGRTHDLDHPHFWRKYFRRRRKDALKDVAKYDDVHESPAAVGKSFRRSIKKHIRQDKIDDNLLERHHSIRRWRNNPSKSQISLFPKEEKKYSQDLQPIPTKSSRKSSYECQMLEESQLDYKKDHEYKVEPSLSDEQEGALNIPMFETGERTSNFYSSVRRIGLANSAPIENVVKAYGGSDDKNGTIVLSKLQANTHEDLAATVGDTEFDFDYDGKTNGKKNTEEDWETFDDRKKNTQLRDFRYSLQKDRLNMDMLNLDYSYASEKEFSFGCTAMSDSNTSICTENAQSMVTVSTATSESASNSINNSSSFEWYANNVMKTLESSVLSLWGIRAVKKGASGDKLENDLTAVPVSKMDKQDDMHMLPIRHSSLTSNLTPSFTSIPLECSRNAAKVDSEIYGNHAKHFI